MLSLCMRLGSELHLSRSALPMLRPVSTIIKASSNFISLEQSVLQHGKHTRYFAPASFCVCGLVNPARSHTMIVRIPRYVFGRSSRKGFISRRTIGNRSGMFAETTATKHT